MWAKVVVKFIRNKRNFLRSKFKRVLPINELMILGWEKAAYLGFGKGSSIYDSSLAFGDIRVGGNTWIGPLAILDSYEF